MQVKNKARQPSAKKQKRKEEVLTHQTPSVTRQISDALVIKEGNPFFVCQPNGDVPIEKGHAFGLYYKDCRFLSGYELRLAGQKPGVLISNGDPGYEAVFELTNPLLELQEQKIQKDSIGIHWTRALDGGRRLLQDNFRFQNYGRTDVQFPVSFSFDADFKDIFIIRHLLKHKLGKAHPPHWDSDTCLRFLYEGTDGITRTTKIDFSQRPETTEGNRAVFRINLRAGETFALSVCILIAEAKAEEEAKKETNWQSHVHDESINMESSFEDWRKSHTQVQSDSLLLTSIVNRSTRDLRMLRSSIRQESFFAAGIPWFATLFGRDSLITSIQTLAFNPTLAAETLRLLARYQGKEVNHWKDEQPGKILHELRVGELANTGTIPHTPYYGSIDATPLFLILLGLYCRWTGDISLLHELRANIDAAINWISQYGDLDGDGYVEYDSTTGKGLVNQGWKDSGNAIVNENGEIAAPPIALVEVQAYVFFAKNLLADLFNRTGESSRAERLKQEARDLQNRFQHDFWNDHIGTYILALQKDYQPAAVVSSNPGHVLWAQMATREQANRTADRLMKGDMFTGWGIRTLSQQEARFNPVGYHLGTVWPHDNSIISAGFKNYGCDHQAHSVMSGILEAAMHFNSYRLPEVFAGFGRKDFGVPVHYPVACHPQAWAAGSILYILTTLLGLEPNAFDASLRIVRPMLPAFADHVTLQNLRVGEAYADIHFIRKGRSDIYANVEVLNVRGTLDIQIES